MPVIRRRRWRRGGLAAGLVMAALAALVGALLSRGPAGGGRHERQAPRDAPRPAPGDARSTPSGAGPPPAADPAPAGLVLGEHRLARVVDGDTVRVDGLDASLRLIGVDAEETFKSAADRRDFEATAWDEYLARRRAGAKRPVKAPTPMGEAARAFGVRWFAGARRVRIERDHPAEIRDRFDRYLAYVLAERDGRWVNYNVELVRAGMSPYFTKYGRSRRFDADFTAAEAEAKAARRGIWEPGAKAYPDYPEREAWWRARGDFVEAFRREGEGKPGYIDLSHEGALDELAARAGQEVHVLATVDDVSRGARGPARLRMEHDRHRSISAVFADPALLARAGAAAWRGEYVVVTGVPRRRGGGHAGDASGGSGRDARLELVVERADQLRLSPVPGLPAPESP